MRTPLSIATAAVILTACGGNNNKTKEVDYSALKTTPLSEQPLVLASQTTLLNHIANGLRLQLQNPGDLYYRAGGIAVDAEASGQQPPTANTADGASKSGFSETNVHVKGVDEADIAKYDGQHWFVATFPKYDTFLINETQPGIKIVATDPATPDATIVGQYQFDERWGDVSEMYLVQEAGATHHVATVRNQWGNVWPMLPGVPFNFGSIMVNDGLVMVEQSSTIAAPTADLRIATDALIWPGPQNSKVLVELVNVKSPSEPEKDWSVELDGSLIDSRKVGNTLYLITRFDPWIRNLNYEFGDLGVRSSNEAALADVTINELMPHFRIAGVEAPLSNDCYLQNGAQDTYGLSSLVHITAIDLGNQKLLSSQCINSNVESMSMSTESLYLTGTVYNAEAMANKTVIHKFELTPTGPHYAATGSADGSLGWNSDPQFRMHEYQDQFRIVTSDWTDRSPEHTLTILQQAGTVLKTLSTLPNEAEPAAIGKPGEDIYSVRFEGERAYIVTFQRTDPLYALDLSDPANPRVAGALEIPGFATYMHPIGSDYLFSLGHSADADGRVTGIKAELLNVANDLPEVVTTLNLGDQYSSSDALADLRALSFLPVGDDQLRITLPINAYQQDQRGNSVWAYSGLQLLQVTGLDGGTATLENAGVVITESAADSNAGNYYSMNRSVLHDDAVFYTHNNDIWVANWYAPKEAKGPIKSPSNVFCTADFRFGLAVTVDLQGNDTGQNACDAKVVAHDGNYMETLQAQTSNSANQCIFIGAGERAGNYEISATLAGFSASQTWTTVYRDECHVIPEAVSLVLEAAEPVICTTQVRPSISLSLSTSDNSDAICDANVYVEHNGRQYPLERIDLSVESDATAAPTDPAKPSFAAIDLVAAPKCQFQGPDELAGDMILYVEHPEYESIEEKLTINQDECHVKTDYLYRIANPLMQF